MISHFNPINLIEVSLEKPNIGELHGTQRAAPTKLCNVSKTIVDLCAAMCLNVNNYIFTLIKW